MALSVSGWPAAVPAITGAVSPGGAAVERISTSEAFDVAPFKIE